jgi:protocatechuate 3,4-dioxygenase beta subunit
MKNFAIPILLLFSMIFISCKKEDTTEPETHGTISGVISEYATDSLIYKATVFTNPATSYVTTDESGKYKISNVEPGEYTVTAAKTGYDTLTVGVTVIAGKTTVADFILHKRDSLADENYGAISGTVYDANTEEPISRVTLYTVPSTAVILSDEQGAFDFERLSPATYLLIARKTGYDSAAITVAVEAGFVSQANLSLTPSDTTEPPQYAKLEGYVLDAVNGKPVSRALVSGSPSFGAVFTDSTGRYVVENLQPAEYQISVVKTYYQNASGEITATAGETVTLNFALIPTTGNIDGTVIDTTGAPIKDVIITTTPETGSFLTDDNGKFEIENVTAGSITVNAEKSGYVSQTVGITVEAGLTREVVIMLRHE